MKRSKLPVIFLFLFIPALLFSAGNRETHEEGSLDRIPEITAVTENSEDRLEVVVTTSIIGDVIYQIVGDEADIAVLIPAGWNPHNFDPAPGDIRRIEEADIIFTNGFELEENLLDDIRNTASGFVVPVSAGIDPLPMDDSDAHGHEEGNPHVWLDPAYVIKWVDTIVTVLQHADPYRESMYRKNGDSYREELEKTDQLIKELIGQIPQDKRNLVTDHSSLDYFAEAYSLHIVGTINTGASTNKELSAKEVASLLEIMNRHSIEAVFVSESSPESIKELARTLADEADRKAAVLSLITGSLMGAGQRGSSYIDLLLFNAEQIVKGLN